jgi:2',3'-cyclic-nucleotide 2'-phosphodiesterase (5'-nucleotidase family)
LTFSLSSGNITPKMRIEAAWVSLALHAFSVAACDECYGPNHDVVLTRHVRRMQPDALGATTGPRGPLEWGQINFLHTTDTHGWLEGHLKEANYGADWGDYVSFVKSMRSKASELGKDLLLIDTGVNIKLLPRSYSMSLTCTVGSSRWRWPE